MIRVIGNEIKAKYVGDRPALQNQSSRSAFFPVSSHSAEMKSFIGHVLWSIRNSNSCKAAPYARAPDPLKINFSPQVLSCMVNMENFNKAGNLTLNSESLKNTICHMASQSFIMRLIYKIRLFLNIGITPEDLFLQKLQSNLEQGVCFGVSLAILNQIRINPTPSSSDIMMSICSEGTQVILFQILQDLKAQLNSDMHYLHLLLHSKRQEDLTDCPAKFLNSDKTERQLLYETGLHLLEEIDGILFPYKTATNAFNTCHQAWQALETAELQGNKFMINLIPITGDGHTLVLDLEKNRFYDQNSGFHEYGSKNELLTAFFNRIHNVYPDLEAGTIELVSFG
jgi:hypothetical protein